MSAQIRAERDACYGGPEETLKGTLDITVQLERFLAGLDRALRNLLDGFDGKLTPSKWAGIAKCSQDTALRVILDLVKRGIQIRDPAGGRSASYSMKELS